MSTEKNPGGKNTEAISLLSQALDHPHATRHQSQGKEMQTVVPLPFSEAISNLPSHSRVRLRMLLSPNPPITFDSFNFSSESKPLPLSDTENLIRFPSLLRCNRICDASLWILSHALQFFFQRELDGRQTAADAVVNILGDHFALVFLGIQDFAR